MTSGGGLAPSLDEKATELFAVAEPAISATDTAVRAAA
jgi:hypothetical protein